MLAFSPSTFTHPKRVHTPFPGRGGGGTAACESAHCACAAPPRPAPFLRPALLPTVSPLGVVMASEA